MLGRSAAPAGPDVVVAESCAGGARSGRGRRCRAARRSGGVIAYANAIKQAELAVFEATIAEHGAVSEAVSL
ncbi:MAG: CinA family protein [Gemmatimonadales bacterium]